MGGILTRWRVAQGDAYLIETFTKGVACLNQKKPSTLEVLEDLDSNIKSLETQIQENQESRKHVVGSLILYSVIVYIGGALLFYFYYLPESTADRLKYSSPLLVFPVLVWLTKRFLHWYFVKRSARTETELRELKVKKRKILEEVMNTETYKKAKEILDKYDPEEKKVPKTPTPPPPTRQGQELRRRTAGQLPPGQTPLPGSPRPGYGRPPPSEPMGRNGQQFMGTPGPPLPRPILARERTTTEKLIEYLVGDGPSNRYALVCTQCMSHNGMALAEEFEYLSFRCCYCYTVNPARKTRPNAPRLNFDTPLPLRRKLGPDPSQTSLADTEGESAEEGSHKSRESEEEKFAGTIQSEKPEVLDPPTAEAKKES